MILARGPTVGEHGLGRARRRLGDRARVGLRPPRRLPFERDAMDIVREPVEDRVGIGRIADRRAPLCDRYQAGDEASSRYGRTPPASPADGTGRRLRTVRVPSHRAAAARPGRAVSFAAPVDARCSPGERFRASKVPQCRIFANIK